MITRDKDGFILKFSHRDAYALEAVRNTLQRMITKCADEIDCILDDKKSKEQIRDLNDSIYYLSVLLQDFNIENMPAVEAPKDMARQIDEWNRQVDEANHQVKEAKKQMKKNEEIINELRLRSWLLGGVNMWLN